MNPNDPIFSQIAPLFDIPVWRIQIRFIAEDNWRITGRENDFRGSLGYNLRKLACMFDNTPCEICPVCSECLYILLFSPIKHADYNFRQPDSLVRPFVFSMYYDSYDSEIESENIGIIDLNLFGPAIKYHQVFLGAAVEALRRFPIEIIDIELLIPDTQPDNSISNNLSDWTDQPFEFPKNSALKCRFLTPLRIVKGNRPSVAELDFSILITAIIRRLRDLKRRYGTDNIMGKTNDEFFEIAKSVTISQNRTFRGMKKRYSFPQKQEVFLNGFRGDIVFEGNFQPFIPLLKAAEIIHVGKGTSCGCGKMQISAIPKNI